MNTRLLRRITKAMQVDPRLFDMKDYSKETRCGTACCIAGWACKLKNCEPSDTWDSYAIAKDLLQLSNQQANRLFFGDEWPRGFGGWGATAEQGVKRIELFISTKGEK